MGDLQCPKATSRASLPPGCRFYPSEEQLLCYYLTNKNKDENFYGCDLIRELDLYDHDPFKLPDTASFSYGYRGRKRHWYCYTVRVVKETRRKSRKVKTGYWIRQGRVRNVLSSPGKVVLGTRTSFAFYLGNSPENAVRTDLMLYEYALLDNLKVSFVLCRVFVKPRPRNNASEIGLSSCAEEIISAGRPFDIQHDKYITPDVEAKVCDDNLIHHKNEKSLYPLRQTSELDSHHVKIAPVSVANFRSSMGPLDSHQETISGRPGGGALFVAAVTSEEHLLSILEEDFIEMDDLL